jgi:hypothetical protein
MIINGVTYQDLEAARDVASGTLGDGLLYVRRVVVGVQGS